MRKYSDKFLNQSSKLKDARIGFEFEFYMKELSYYKTLEILNDKGVSDKDDFDPEFFLKKCLLLN